jgi:hypothetical protein
VVPGTYRATVAGQSGSRNLPKDTAVVKDAPPVTASAANVELDVQTYPVGGKVTLNGLVPTDGASRWITRSPE